MEPVIELGGGVLELMFVGEHDLTKPAMDGIVRMFQELDDDMYRRWREKRWRHFLPVEFTVKSVSKC